MMNQILWNARHVCITCHQAQRVTCLSSASVDTQPSEQVHVLFQQAIFHAIRRIPRTQRPQLVYQAMLEDQNRENAQHLAPKENDTPYARWLWTPAG